jgi:hypothetical protein
MTAPPDPHASPPPFWDREIPRYLATKNLWPAEKVRFRYEPPLAQMADGDVWQYAHKPVVKGAEIQTKCWPPPSGFRPLNYSAARVLQFFNERQKSRLPWSPWRRDRVVLDDGLTSSMAPRISIGNGDAA